MWGIVGGCGPRWGGSLRRKVGAGIHCRVRPSPVEYVASRAAGVRTTPCAQHLEAAGRRARERDEVTREQVGRREPLPLACSRPEV